MRGFLQDARYRSTPRLSAGFPHNISEPVKKKPDSEYIAVRL